MSLIAKYKLFGMYHSENGVPERMDTCVYALSKYLDPKNRLLSWEINNGRLRQKFLRIYKENLNDYAEFFPDKRETYSRNLTNSVWQEFITQMKATTQHAVQNTRYIETERGYHNQKLSEQELREYKKELAYLNRMIKRGLKIENFLIQEAKKHKGLPEYLTQLIDQVQAPYTRSGFYYKQFFKHPIALFAGIALSAFLYMQQRNTPNKV